MHRYRYAGLAVLPDPATTSTRITGGFVAKINKYEVPFKITCIIEKTNDGLLENEYFSITINAMCEDELYSYSENFDGIGIMLI